MVDGTVVQTSSQQVLHLVHLGHMLRLHGAPPQQSQPMLASPAQPSGPLSRDNGYLSALGSPFAFAVGILSTYISNSKMFKNVSVSVKEKNKIPNNYRGVSVHFKNSRGLTGARRAH